MPSKKILSQHSFPFIITSFLLCCLFVIVFVKKTTLDQFTGYAIIFDLIITIPLIYFFLIRQTKIFNFTTVTLSIAGLFIAGWLLPENFDPVIGTLRTYFIPLLEVFIFSFVLIKIYHFRKSLNNHSDNFTDALQLLRNNFEDLFGNKTVAGILTMELGIFYYAFISWKPQKPDIHFTGHKHSGTLALFSALIVVIIAETIGFHFFLIKWNSTIAWIFTITSIYAMLQIMAHLKAMIQRPVSIENNELVIRYGIFMECRIPIDKIEYLEKSTSTPLKEKDTQKMALLGEAESHNLLISLKEPETLIKAYGNRKLFKKLYFYVDEPTKLIGTINKLCLKKSFG